MESLDDHLLTSENLQITPILKTYMTDMAYWGRLIGITGMIMSGLIGVFVVIAFIFGSSILFRTMGDALPGFVLILYAGMIISSLAFGFYVSYLLFSFANETREAFDANNQFRLETGFNHLRRIFKIYGIFLIIVIGLYALMFLLSMLGLLFR